MRERRHMHRLCKQPPLIKADEQHCHTLYQPSPPLLLNHLLLLLPLLSPASPLLPPPPPCHPHSASPVPTADASYPQLPTQTPISNTPIIKCPLSPHVMSPPLLTHPRIAALHPIRCSAHHLPLPMHSHHPPLPPLTLLHLLPLCRQTCLLLPHTLLLLLNSHLVLHLTQPHHHHAITPPIRPCISGAVSV